MRYRAVCSQSTLLLQTARMKHVHGHIEIFSAVGEERRRQWMLGTLCLGALLSGLNSTIVNVALPSMRLDLRFTEAALVWVINGYVAAHGGFLLLSGRLGDLFGGRPILLVGISTFAGASLAAALSTSQLTLVIARLIQGLGGAVLSAVGLAEIMKLFFDTQQRSKAIGLYIFVSAMGGSIGLLLGGVLTSALSWRWAFLINVPVCAIMFLLCSSLLPAYHRSSSESSLDIAGALTSTLSLLLASYAMLHASQSGWSAVSIAMLFASVGLLVTFVLIESRAPAPLIPLSLFRRRNLAVASMAGALLVTALLAWRLFEALYLQLVLELTPIQVGMAFVPANVIIAVISLVALPAITKRFGLRCPIVTGMLVTAIGLAMLAIADARDGLGPHVIIGMLLIGLGVGLAHNSLLLIAMHNITATEAGAASGIATTAMNMGSGLGLSVLGGIAAARTNELLLSGVMHPSALNSGYQRAFWIAAIALTIGTLVARFRLSDGKD